MRGLAIHGGGLGLSAVSSSRRPSLTRRSLPDRALDALLPGRCTARDELVALARLTGADSEAVDRSASRLSSYPSFGSVLGSWRLLFTTEQSVQALSGLLGGVLGVTQEVELETGETAPMKTVRVKNVLQWRYGLRLEAFAVGSLVGRRLRYSFSGVSLLADTLTLFSTSFDGPGGWSDSVYADDCVRVVRNSRADLLVFTRGP
jgi:hypothetical protein